MTAALATAAAIIVALVAAQAGYLFGSVTRDAERPRTADSRIWRGARWPLPTTDRRFRRVLHLPAARSVWPQTNDLGRLIARAGEFSIGSSRASTCPSRRSTWPASG
jgi:hypothetical protein